MHMPEKSCLVRLWVECRVENVPYKKSPICRRTLPSSGIIWPASGHLHVETIIYHKENENNPLKSWPTRVVEYVSGCRDCESGQSANTN